MITNNFKTEKNMLSYTNLNIWIFLIKFFSLFFLTIISCYVPSRMFSKNILFSALCWTKYVITSLAFLFCDLTVTHYFLSSPLPDHSAVFFHLIVSFFHVSIFCSCIFVSLCTRNSSCSFTQSLPPFVLLLIRFCLPQTHTLSHTHTDSLLSLCPLCWPPLARCHNFSHKWSPLCF